MVRATGFRDQTRRDARSERRTSAWRRAARGAAPPRAVPERKPGPWGRPRDTDVCLSSETMRPVMVRCARVIRGVGLSSAKREASQKQQSHTRVSSARRRDGRDADYDVIIQYTPEYTGSTHQSPHSPGVSARSLFSPVAACSSGAYLLVTTAVPVALEAPLRGGSALPLSIRGQPPGSLTGSGPLDTASLESDRIPCQIDDTYGCLVPRCSIHPAARDSVGSARTVPALAASRPTEGMCMTYR